VEPTPCKPQSTHSARYTTLLEVHVKDFKIRNILPVAAARKELQKIKKFLQLSQRLASHL
jgi:glutaredoxin-related protein